MVNTAAPTQPAAEADLLARLRRRDPRAGHELFTRYAADVNRVIWRLLGGDAEHNDLVHDVFVMAWTELAAGKRPLQLGPWLVGIAVHRVRREIRRRGVRRRFLKLAAPFARRAVQPNVEATDLLRRIYALLGQLDADDRIAFILRYLDRRSLRETAAACHCSLATAKRRLQRARRRLVELSVPHPDLHAMFVATAEPEGTAP